MANLKEVKKRISSVISTQQITRAMKMVAAAKFRRAQQNILQMRPYATKMSEVLLNVTSSLEVEGNIYGQERDEDNILIIAISSDRGLCGPFNSIVFKAVVSLIDTKYRSQYQSGDVTILPIGKKSSEFFSKRKYHIIDDYANTFNELSFDKVREVAGFVMKGFIENQFDKVEIVYNEFKNVATQILRTEQYLPILEDEMAQHSSDIDYIFQPNRQQLVSLLIPKFLNIQLYKAILESNASEHGARMTAMDKATENADDILRDLKLTYNQTRQAAITKEILEIVAGAEALG